MAHAYTAFVGPEFLASGDLQSVALAVHRAQDLQTQMPVVFEDDTGRVVDLDLRGTAEDVVRRLAPGEEGAQAPRPRGRPKLGVTAREITLLPRHWDWLARQPGGASATLRKLVEQAARSGVELDRRRDAQTAAYRVMSVLAGHLPGYEDALRALYSADAGRFDEIAMAWPSDVAAYALRLAHGSFAPSETPAPQSQGGNA